MIRITILLAACLLCSVARAAPVVDASNSYSPPSGSGITLYWVEGRADTNGASPVQTFTPSMSGLLTSVDLLLGDKLGWQTAALVGVWSLDEGTLNEQLAYTVIDSRKMNGQGAGIGFEWSWTNVPFPLPANLESGRPYALTVSGLTIDTLRVGVAIGQGFGSTYDGGAGGIVSPVHGGAIAFNDFGYENYPIEPFDLNFQTWMDSAPTAAIVGDVNGDGKVDLTDFGLLKANFGRTSQAVPEPSTYVLLIVGSILLTYVNSHARRT